MNLRSVEDWHVIFQTLSVIFVMLAVGAGAGTILTGFITHKRQNRLVAEEKVKSAQDVTNLQSSAVDADRKRAEAERALQELEQQQPTAQKGITPAQRHRFLYLMDRLPKGKVEIRFIEGNTDSTELASTLADMLKEAGCDVVEPFLPFLSPGKVPVAIGLRIKDDQNVPRHAVSLQKTLERIGIKTPAQVEDAGIPIEPDVVRVYVYGDLNLETTKP
jgi:hypothetical protein